MINTMREIERKFIIKTKEKSTKKLIKRISDHLTDKRIIDKVLYKNGYGQDSFYKVSRKDLLRLRASSDRNHQLTLKRKDKKTIIDRFEININILDSDLLLTSLLLEKLYGKPVIEFSKTYSLLWLDDKKCNNIVVYKTDFCNDMFLEIEAHSLSFVNNIYKILTKSFELIPIYKSLVEVYKECYGNI